MQPLLQHDGLLYLYGQPAATKPKPARLPHSTCTDVVAVRFHGHCNDTALLYPVYQAYLDGLHVNAITLEALPLVTDRCGPAIVPALNDRVPNQELHNISSNVAPCGRIRTTNYRILYKTILVGTVVIQQIPRAIVLLFALSSSLLL